MITPSVRAFVSFAATMAVTAALGACVRSASPAEMNRPQPIESRTLAIRFDNSGRERVDVYLIGDRREWLLGRVAPGAIATLRIPEASLSGGSQFMRLAVLTGEQVTVQAARDPRATFTVVQPTSALLAQQWKFSDGQLTPIWR